MKKTTIFLFKLFYKLFKKVFGSNELDSFEGAISLTILVYLLFILFFGNYIILRLLNYNFIKQKNEWLIIVIFFIFYFIFYKVIKKQTNTLKEKLVTWFKQPENKFLIVILLAVTVVGIIDDNLEIIMIVYAGAFLYGMLFLNPT